MGGPMNIYQHRDHPWLVAEKAFIAEVIAAGKPVLGICLGAQLIADALGGKVFQNSQKEIGWFPIQMLDRAEPFAGFPEALTAIPSRCRPARGMWRRAWRAQIRDSFSVIGWSGCNFTSRCRR